MTPSVSVVSFESLDAQQPKSDQRPKLRPTQAGANRRLSSLDKAGPISFLTINPVSTSYAHTGEPVTVDKSSLQASIVTAN